MKLDKLPAKAVLIGIGPIRLILDDGRTVVFESSARMYGLPNGSVAIEGPRKIVGRAKKTIKDVPELKSVIYNRPVNMVPTLKANRRGKKLGKAKNK